MVVCKFFLQGTCKFGDFCKYEHQVPDNLHSYNAPSILRQSQFSNPQSVKPVNPGNIDVNTLVKSVVNDMTSAEKGGQWLLSCYAPFKEKPAFPGFEDQSFEEIRLGYYEAVKNGTVEQYKQQIQSMLQQAVMKMKSLQAPTPDIVNLLNCIYNTPPSSYCGVYGTTTTSTTSSPFGNITNTSGVFNQQQTSQNIFGNPTQPQTQFGGTSSGIFGGRAPQNQTFGGQTNNSLFRNAQNVPQNAPINIFRQATNNFAGQNGGSIFGTQSNANSIFRGQSAAGSIFANPQATSAPFIGGQQNAAPTFMQPNNNSVFGGFTNANQNSTMNSVQNTSNIFTNQPPQTTFGPQVNQQQSSMFNQQQNAGTVLGQQNMNSFGQQSVMDAKSHTSSIFGGGQSTLVTSPQFGQIQQIDKTVYSKLEELSEEDIKWFQSDDFDGPIPEKPPTYEMCFKA